MTKGRPSSYTPGHAEQAQQAYERGLTDEDVAREIGIVPSTLYRWRHEHPDFERACTIGKELAGNRVEDAFFQRATGFDYVAERPYMPANGTKPVVARYTRHVLADWRASLQWLRIRRAEKWRVPREDDGKRELHDIIEEAFLRVAEKREAEGREHDAD